MKITAQLQKSRVHVRPAQYLDNNFNAYVEACRQAGGKFVPEAKAYSFPIEALPELKKNLEAAQFSLVLDDTLRHSISAKIDDIQELHERLTARIDRIEIDACVEVRPYQKVGARFLAERDRACLFDSMGLGKSAQALLALPDNPIPPLIVVCPAVAKGVWAREIGLWRPDFGTVDVISGKDGFRWPRGGEAVVMNYDILPDFDLVPESVFDKLIEGTVIIGDEAHLLKSFRTQRFQRFSAVASRIRSKKGKTWLLTGTPLMNRPPELWSILQAAGLHSETFSSWGNFRALFGGYESAYGGLQWDRTPDPAAVECLKKTTLRRRREDVLLDLPGKTHGVHPVEIDAKTTKQLTLIEESLTKNGVTLDQALRLARSDGSVFEQLSRARQMLAVAKIPALLELVETYEAQDTPLVVFSAHTNPIDTLAKRPGWVAITGATSDENRTKYVQQFQRGELKGIAGTIGAMGVAITLTYAAHAIFVDLDWTPTNNEQAEDRLCRLGQTKGVSITRLVSSSKIDKRLLAILSRKQTLIDAAVNASAVKSEELSDTLGSSLNTLLNDDSF